jgi:uncharacterized protein (TIGR02598 family)
MKPPSSGFSLVEVVMAVAILGTVGVALIAVLCGGMAVSKDAVADAEVSMVVENVQSRLVLDPQWPGERTELLFDNSGAEVATEGEAAFRAKLESVRAPGFTSDYLDAIQLRIHRVPGERGIATALLQRTRLRSGLPSPPR